MSNQLFDLNEDLKKLKDDGFDVSIVSENLVIKGIPYVNTRKEIQFGCIYCPLVLSGQKTVPPQNHTAWFVGEHPCDQFGTENNSFVNSAKTNALTPEINASFYLSSKPENGQYPDFYVKMKRYIDLISAPAKSIDQSVSPQKFEYQSYTEPSVFKYPDTFTARAGISNISAKIKDQKIAIVGLGGTGSFVCDFVSKTPVKQISLFDGDQMLNHNAFRIPGAMTLDELTKRPSKVDYLKEKYEALRDGIIAHEVFLDESNVNLLAGHDFVFLAIDRSDNFKAIIEFLISSKIPFVDLGMGLSLVDDSIRGLLRRTLILPESHSNTVPMGQTDDKDLYSQNIQIAELNALNAALGILAWKKHFGFYAENGTSHSTIFIIDEEEIVNEA